VCRFLVDGACQSGLLGEAFRPSEKSFVARSRFRQAASCAGSLARSRARPADLAAIGILDPRVAKFPSDRERFARSQDRIAQPATSSAVFANKKSALIFDLSPQPVFGLVGQMLD
jgi:hypothetical protein